MMANLLGMDFIPVLNKKLPAQNIKNSALFPTILLGRDVLDELGLKVGESVTLVSTLPDDGPGGMGPQQLPVVIAGILDSDSSASDKKLVRSSLNTANLFFSTNDSWLGLQLKLKHPFLADEISLLLSKQLPKVQNVTLKSIPWTEENRAFLKALALEHYGMSFVIGMIILVGCFSICISLLLSVRRKSKEMAILRSMGFEQLDLSKLYLLQGFCIGLIGVSIGLVLGFFVLYLIHHIDLPFLTGSYSAGPLPVLVSVQDVIIVSVGSLLLSMLAAVWPAIEVKKLDVIEILSIRN
jgi:lipoprotein-releasing system permease protein